jgi:hypothetical protein
MLSRLSGVGGEEQTRGLTKQHWRQHICHGRRRLSYDVTPDPSTDIKDAAGIAAILPAQLMVS